MSPAFYNDIRYLAHATRELSSNLEHRVGGTYSDCPTRRDYVHTSEIAALYGYATVAQWRAWCGRHDITDATELQATLHQALRAEAPPLHVLTRVRALDLAVDGTLVIRAAQRWLGRELHGVRSSYGDLKQRRRTRRWYPTWDFWEGHGDAAAEQPDLLADLETALEHVLNPWEFYVIREHFFRGRRQRELAKELAATPGKYAGDWPRAEKWIGKTVQRALGRARRRLGAQWQAVSQDLHACN